MPLAASSMKVFTAIVTIFAVILLGWGCHVGEAVAAEDPYEVFFSDDEPTDLLFDSFAKGAMPYEVWVAIPAETRHFLKAWCLINGFNTLLQIPRDLDMVDMFAGEAALSRTFKSHGFFAAEYDVKHDNMCNILSYVGFAIAIVLTLRLRIGGLLFAGWSCSSFSWMSLSVTKRCAENGYWGDLTQPSVITGNEILHRTLLLMRLAQFRICLWVGENPGLSRAFKLCIVIQLLVDLMVS